MCPLAEIRPSKGDEILSESLSFQWKPRLVPCVFYMGQNQTVCALLNLHHTSHLRIINRPCGKKENPSDGKLIAGTFKVSDFNWDTSIIGHGMEQTQPLISVVLIFPKTLVAVSPKACDGYCTSTGARALLQRWSQRTGFVSTSWLS